MCLSPFIKLSSVKILRGKITSTPPRVKGMIFPLQEEYHTSLYCIDIDIHKLIFNQKIQFSCDFSQVCSIASDISLIHSFCTY